MKKNHKVCFKKRERIRFCLDGPFWLLPLSFTRPRRSKYSISNSLCCPFFFIYLRDVSFLPVDSLFIVYSFSDQILYGPAVLSPYSYLDVALHIRDTRAPFFIARLCLVKSSFLRHQKKQGVLFELDMMVLIIKVNCNHN